MVASLIPLISSSRLVVQVEAAYRNNKFAIIIAAQAIWIPMATPNMSARLFVHAGLTSLLLELSISICFICASLGAGAVTGYYCTYAANVLDLCAGAVT